MSHLSTAWGAKRGVTTPGGEHGVPILGEKHRVPNTGARSRRNSSWLVVTVPMMRWLWGELPAAGGSAPKGSPYTNETQALAKPEPFLWLDHAPTSLPCARNAAQG